MSERESLSECRHLTPADERKIAAYDSARATVKTEGNTRAYYVLRAEAAEAAVLALHHALQDILDAAERARAGFPIESEEWYARRDYARIQLSRDE